MLAKSAGPCTLFIDALSEPITSGSYGASGKMYIRGDDGIVVDDDKDNARVWNDDEDTGHVWDDSKDDTDHEWNKAHEDTEHNFDKRK